MKFNWIFRIGISSILCLLWRRSNFLLCMCLYNLRSKVWKWIQREELKATLCFHTLVSVSPLIMKITFTRLIECYISSTWWMYSNDIWSSFCFSPIFMHMHPLKRITIFSASQCKWLWLEYLASKLLLTSC